MRRFTDDSQQLRSGSLSVIVLNFTREACPGRENHPGLRHSHPSSLFDPFVESARNINDRRALGSHHLNLLAKSS